MADQPSSEPLIDTFTLVVYRNAVDRVIRLVKAHNRKLDNLNRIAELDIKPVTLDTIRSYFIEGGIECETYDPASSVDPGRIVWFSELKITAQSVMVGGWRILTKYVRAVDRSKKGEIGLLPREYLFTQLQDIPNIDLQAFRDKSDYCMHCKVPRRRYVTYLLVKDGEAKIFGSSCVNKYIPGTKSWAEYANFRTALLDELEKAKPQKSDHPSPNLEDDAGASYPIPVYLSCVRMLVRNKGEFNQYTADEAYHACQRLPLEGETETAEKMAASQPIAPTEDDRASALDDLDRVKKDLAEKKDSKLEDVNLKELIRQGKVVRFRAHDNLVAIASVYTRACEIRRLEEQYKQELERASRERAKWLNEPVEWPGEEETFSQYIPNFTLGSRQRVPFFNAPWFHFQKGNVLLGILEGVYDRPDPPFKFFQIKMLKSCECRLGRELNGQIGAGSIVNLAYVERTKVLEGVASSIRDGAEYLVWVRVDGKIEISAGRSMWDLDVRVKQIKAEQRPVKRVDAGESDPEEPQP